MQTNICKLTGKAGEMKALLNEVEKCTAYNGLDKQSAMRLRLLAEELVSMLPQLLKHSEGTFVMSNDGNIYEMRVSLKATGVLPVSREKLLSVSSTGKNAAAGGIMGRIRDVADRLLTPPEDMSSVPSYYEDEMDAAFGDVWSLRRYVDEVKYNVADDEKEEKNDELERSIVAKIADDVQVGIRGRHVDIVVIKELA